MPKQYRKHLTFQAGEISPRYFGRSDDEIYYAGLQEALNMTVDQRGGIYKRTGLLHKAQIDANDARVFTLQATRARFYTIVIYHFKMLILAPGAKIAGDNLLLNGTFLNFGANWQSQVVPTSSQVVFNLGEAILRPEQELEELVANSDFLLDDIGWTVRESGGNSKVEFDGDRVILLPRQQNNGYAGIAQEISTSQVGVEHTITIDGDQFNSSVRVRAGTSEADGTYLDTTISNDDALVFTPAASPFWITIDCEFPDQSAILNSVSVKEPIVSLSRISQQATVTAGIADSHVAIVSQNSDAQVTIDIGTTDGASDIASITSTDHEIELAFIPNNATYWVSVTAFGTETVEAKIAFVGTADITNVGINGIEMDAPWTEDQLKEIHIIESQEGDALYFTHSNVNVMKLVYDRATDLFTDLAVVNFTNPPPEWTGTNHPSTGAAMQGRLFLGGTPAQSQTTWGSVSGSPEDFTVTVEDDSSALEFTIQRFGRIEWMLGTKNLIIGTDQGENVIISEGPVLTPSDLGVEIQSSYGSNNIQAIQVSEKVFYVTPDGRKVRAMAYNRDENNWVSQDLNFISEHVTIPIATRTAWGQHPNDLFMMSLGDGNIAVLTYDRTAQTTAWTRYDLGSFKVLDIDTGRENGVNKFVMVGQRTPGKVDIEITAPANQFLDSYASKFDIAGTNVIDGLDHLEGLQVRPIVDGAVDPLQVVVGGQVTTQRTGKQLYAGVGYTGRIKTLPPDEGIQIRSWKKRWNKVWAYLLDSKQPLINGFRPPDRTPSTPMDTVEPDQTGHFKTIDLGWDDFGQITIEQDLPVAMYVLAIYGEMGAETL